MGRALVPSLGGAGWMERVGEEHERAVLMLRGDQRRDPAAEGMATDGCLAGRWGRGQIDRHRGLGTALRKLDGGRIHATPPQARDLGRETRSAAGCTMGKVQVSHAGKRRAGEPSAWYT